MHDHRRRAAPATTRNSCSVKKRHPSQDEGWNGSHGLDPAELAAMGFRFLLGWWMICWASVLMAVLMRQRGSCRGSGPRRGDGCLVSLLPWVYGMDVPCLQVAADYCNGIDGKNIFAKQSSRNQNWMLSWWDTGILQMIWCKKSLVSLMLCDMVWGPCLQFADFIAMEYDCKNMLHNKLQNSEPRSECLWVCATYIKCISCMMTLWRTRKIDSHMFVTIARSWVLPFGLHPQQSHLLLLYTFQESLECAVVTSTLPNKIQLQRIVRRATNCKKLIAKDSYVSVFP
jgi:hypothetical protein